jgi:hypothetical protein
MKKLLLLTLLLIPTAAFADSILYTFSTVNGVNGVNGSFTLDDSAPFEFIGQGLWRYGGFAPTPIFAYYAATPFIAGTYGAYSLFGAESGGLSGSSVGLHITDFEPPYDAAWEQARSDEWIFRANVSSDVVNGRSVTGFAILGFGSMDALNGPSYNPPSVNGLGIQRSQVLVGFSDGSSEALLLSSLTLVPELPSLTLLPLGLLGIGFLKKRITASYTTDSWAIRTTRRRTSCSQSIAFCRRGPNLSTDNEIVRHSSRESSGG